MATNDGKHSLVTIPVFGLGEIPLVESLLQAAGIRYVALPGDNESTCRRLQVSASDLADVKELLADFKVRTSKDKLVPIP